MSNLHPRHIRFPSEELSEESDAVFSVQGPMLQDHAPTAPTVAAMAAIVGNPLPGDSEDDSNKAFFDAQREAPADGETGLVDTSSSASSGGSSSLSTISAQEAPSGDPPAPVLEVAVVPEGAPVVAAAPEAAPAPAVAAAPGVAVAPEVVAAPEAAVASLGMTPAQIQVQNRIYKKKFPNWTMSLHECPALSHVQTDYNDGFITLGGCTMRRPRQKENAALYAKVLTADVVAGLLADGKLSAGLAQDIGALLMEFKYPVPYNLVGAGLPDPTNPVNPKEPPKPSTEVMRILGIMFSTVDAVLHFKEWYEKGPGDVELTFGYAR